MKQEVKCPHKGCKGKMIIDINTFATNVKTCKTCGKEFTYKIVEIKVSVEPVILRGAHIKKTWNHNAGAYAQCACGRYTDDPTVFRTLPMCDCGRHDGWSIHFESPTHDSKWSSHYHSSCEDDVE